jgi:hypothetical protein
MAFAEDIVMSVDQSEYYFKTGDNAVIPLEIQNDYGRQISGMLQYTITQQMRQANTQFSTSNTQASTFAIDGGTQTISLDFGTSDSPSTVTVDLNFIYNDGTQINVILDPITIHFVIDESQKNNTQNKMQSSSQQQSSAQNSPSNAQQSLQQKLDELMNQQSPMSQDPQQRLQNNQLAQDSNALKKEIQEQLQEENSLKKLFESELASNEDFQKSHNQLLQQGYNVTDGSLNPSDAKTGDFEVNYQNEQGKWAQIQGNMVNGTMTEMESQTQEETENLLEQLRAHPDFIRYDEELILDDFSEQNIEFTYDSNKTTIQVQYNNEENETAVIFGDFESDKFEKVYLEKPNQDNFNWVFILYIILVVIVSYVLYRFFSKNKKEPVPITPKIIPQPYNNTTEVKKLIQEGKEHFENNNFKDAYGKINQALRLFLSHELNLNKEITNENILEHIPRESYAISDIEECFRIASLVEFAKYSPNEDDFSKIVSITENIVNKKS